MFNWPFSAIVEALAWLVSALCCEGGEIVKLLWNLILANGFILLEELMFDVDGFGGNKFDTKAWFSLFGASLFEIKVKFPECEIRFETDNKFVRRWI